MFPVLVFVSLFCSSEFGTTCAVYIEQNITYRNNRKPTYRNDYDVSSDRTPTYRNDYGVSLDRAPTYKNYYGVSSDWTPTYRNDYGVSSDRTPTYRNGYDVSSDRATTYRNGYGVSTDRTPIYRNDYGVSSDQTPTYRKDYGVSSDRIPTYRNYDGVSSDWTPTYRNDYDVSSDRTPTYRNDYGVSSDRTPTYRNDYGVSLDRTPTYRNDYGVSSDRTPTYRNDYGVSSDRTPTYRNDYGVSSDRTPTYRKDYGVSLDRTPTYRNDYGVSSDRTRTYRNDYGVSSDRTPTYRKDYGVSLDRTRTYRNDYGVSSDRTPTYRNDYGVSLDRTPTYRNDFGVSSELITTYKDDDGVSSEQTKTYMDDYGITSDRTTNYIYNYGVSVGRTVETSSVEKIKYRNQIKCEITDLIEIVLPSALGRAYFVHKSGQSLLIWFDDFNFISVTISKNCVRLALDMLLNYYINTAYFQDFLTNCPNGTFIQNIFCDSSLAYNISYIKGVFPHFSNVRIYFMDKFNHCTAQFNVFLKSENYLLTNADIYHFLTNETICWKYAYFANLLNVQFSLKEIRDNKGILLTHASYSPVYIILKHQACNEQFLRYIYWNGLHVKDNDTYLLSVDNIITFNKANNCIRVRFSCPATYYQVFYQLPSSTVVYAESAIVVEVTIVNGFMLYIFLQKENRTPSTLLLSALAISDTITAILMTIPKCIAYQIYGNEINYRGIMPKWYIFDFPQCVIYGLLNDLKYTFHFVSVLLTTLLCLQKTAVLLFPMWSKRYLNNSVSVICSVCVVIFCFCIYSPILYFTMLMEEIQGSCCGKSSAIYFYFYLIVNGCSILACLIVAVFTVYIICKLTILRRNLPWTDSLAVQKRNRISALTVVLICIFFILSESMFNVTVLLFTLGHFNIVSEWPLFYKIMQYTDLSLITGFSLNFIIYIVMSRQLRNKLWTNVTKIVRCCKCW